MARQLGQAGVTVVLAARDPQKGEAAAGKLRGEGLDVQFLKLDVTDKADHAAASAFLKERFGRLDILINNAGISAEVSGPGRSVLPPTTRFTGRLKRTSLRRWP
jgi:NAD(P)-dependent dehydrogenase (short-subunit alcohol dehydrogenase family)